MTNFCVWVNAGVPTATRNAAAPPLPPGGGASPAVANAVTTPGSANTTASLLGT
jgi:hypothetical protein